MAITLGCLLPQLSVGFQFGNRLYQNKYELNEWLQEARSKGINDPRDIWHYARQKETALHGA